MWMAEQPQETGITWRRRRKHEPNEQVCSRAEGVMQKRQSKQGAEGWAQAAGPDGPELAHGQVEASGVSCDHPMGQQQISELMKL